MVTHRSDATATVHYPGRFLAGEDRNRGIGRPLRRLARVSEPDEDLLDRIGQALMQRDEVAAALVAAMRRDAHDPGRVTMGQFKAALESGVDVLPHCPAELRGFFDVVENTPDWVDFDLINVGAAAYRRYGNNVADVMTQLALIGGYRFGGPSDLLVETGGLTGATTLRRLAETQQWAIAVTEHDALRRDQDGFKLTVHVRLMHALVNQQFETDGRWDIGQWGLPINQSDQAGTLGLFNSTLLIGLRLLGVRVTASESRAIMHLWKYVGWLLGVDEYFLCDRETEQHRLNYHILLSQGPLSGAGAPLAKSIVDTQRRLYFPNLPRLRGGYARARLLSMLRFFLRKDGMRDLDLPLVPPLAVVGIIVANLVRYQVLSRTRAGRRYLQRWGERCRERTLHRHFGAADHQLAQLPG